MLLVALATSACQDFEMRRVFGERRVYSANATSANMCYDSDSDRILEENTWVFHPNGAFQAVVEIDGRELALSGDYTAEPTGSVMAIWLDYDGDGKSDDNLGVGEGASYLVWQYKTETFTYTLAP
jgi:hypothetical protein